MKTSNMYAHTYVAIATCIHNNKYTQFYMYICIYIASRWIHC